MGSHHMEGERGAFGGALLSHLALVTQPTEPVNVQRDLEPKQLLQDLGQGKGPPLMPSIGVSLGLLVHLASVADQYYHLFWLAGEATLYRTLSCNSILGYWAGHWASMVLPSLTASVSFSQSKVGSSQFDYAVAGGCILCLQVAGSWGCCFHFVGDCHFMKHSLNQVTKVQDILVYQDQQGQHLYLQHVQYMHPVVIG